MQKRANGEKCFFLGLELLLGQFKNKKALGVNVWVN